MDAHRYQSVTGCKSMFKENKLFWMSFRQALLQIVNAIEVELRGCGLYSGPTTSEIRAMWKEMQAPKQ